MIIWVFFGREPLWLVWKRIQRENHHFGRGGGSPPKKETPISLIIVSHNKPADCMQAVVFFDQQTCHKRRTLVRGKGKHRDLMPMFYPKAEI